MRLQANPHPDAQTRPRTAVSSPRLASVFSASLGTARYNSNVTKRPDQNVVDVSFPYTISAGVELS